MYSNEDGTCWAQGCYKSATHILTTLVHGRDGMSDTTNVVKYCLHCCMYFAAWLPYCYPGEYELISITPPASELFGKD